MFIDEAKIFIKAGKGGDGAVSFRREKYVANGGPDGGDGGNGGNIVFLADENVRTLADFRYKKKYIGNDGENGGKRNCSGKYGEDTIIRVPMGTLVRDADTEGILADLSMPKQIFIAVKGGKGGAGNQHFAKATRQIPTFAKSGTEGESRFVKLELKLLAEVGLIGFPNVGKSTLLSRVSSARPKIANYHFTTLTPNLGVVKIDRDFEFVIADIPGLIEGAHAGTGLGHDFLRHIERTKLLIHVVDISESEGRDPIADFDKINNELKLFKPELMDRPQLVAANKADVILNTETVEKFTKEMNKRGYEVFVISAVTGTGLQELIYRTAELVRVLPDTEIFEVTDDYKEYIVRDDDGFEIEKFEDYYVVSGDTVEKLMGSVNLDDYESLGYFQRRLRNLGIIEALEKEGVQEGDTVCIGNFEFNYMK
ncbi:MAG: GTPase ObgE [Clostridia bacterium]|nr:GTPase ObgE [Clostridia bacterium]